MIVCAPGEVAVASLAVPHTFSRSPCGETERKKPMNFPSRSLFPVPEIIAKTVAVVGEAELYRIPLMPGADQLAEGGKPFEPYPSMTALKAAPRSEIALLMAIASETEFLATSSAFAD